MLSCPITLEAGVMHLRHYVWSPTHLRHRAPSPTHLRHDGSWPTRLGLGWSSEMACVISVAVASVSTGTAVGIWRSRPGTAGSAQAQFRHTEPVKG